MRYLSFPALAILELWAKSEQFRRGKRCRRQAQRSNSQKFKEASCYAKRNVQIPKSLRKQAANAISILGVVRVRGDTQLLYSTYASSSLHRLGQCSEWKFLLEAALLHVRFWKYYEVEVAPWDHTVVCIYLY
jgi:hypothetical protein